MADKFSHFYSSFEGPAVDGFTITPSDSTVFSQPSRAIYVGTAGNISAQLNGANTILLFTNVPAGTILPIRVNMVLATNTTANGMIGLF